MTCNTPIGSGTLSFLCDLPSGHDGPHKAQGNDRSLRARAQWEEAQRDLQGLQATAVLRETQGPGLTMADRTEGNETGTPPPGFFPCRYHQVIHHQDQRSEKCMAWSGDHDGPRPRTIQRLPQTMGSVTTFPPLPDMPGDSERPSMVYEQQGTQMVERIEPDPVLPEDPRAHLTGDGHVPVPTRSVPRAGGEQGLPMKNDRPNAQDALILAIEARKAIGLERYGTLLQPFNARNSFKDLLDEFVDGAVYAQALEMERVEMVREVAVILEEVVHEFGARSEIAVRLSRVLGWLQGSATG